MWLCLNKGFLSIIKNRREDNLIVRARQKEHLAHYFPNEPIVHTPNNDYAYRVFLTKANFAAWLTDVVDEIDYFNFKNSVKDHTLHNFYEDVWFLGVGSLGNTPNNQLKRNNQLYNYNNYNRNTFYIDDFLK